MNTPIAQALLAAVAIVGPVAALSAAVGIAKDGSPFRKSFWL